MKASSGSGECPRVKASGARHIAACYLSAKGHATNSQVFDCYLRYPSASDSLTHMAKMAKTGLGKGLGALIGTRPAPVRQDVDLGESVHQVRLATIVPSALQPRKNFAPEALQELVDSIRQHGI